MDFYHILNRGVEKRTVVQDEKDCVRFIHDLYEFNDEAPADSNNAKLTNRQYTDIGCPYIEKRKRKLLVYIHAYCLMPNHYHFLLSPAVENGIPRFIKKLAMGYAKYFNEKYSRSGSLWQGKYKKIHIQRDAHFFYIPYYIHLNPLDLSMPEWREGKVQNSKKALEVLDNYRWSSHLDYSGKKNFPSIITTKALSDVLRSPKNYRRQIEEIISDPDVAPRSESIE